MRKSQLRMASYVESPARVTQSTIPALRGPQPSENRQCTICAETTVTQYTRKIFTCEHNQICTTCQNQYVLNCLDQGNMPKCLAADCPGTIKHEDSIAMNMLQASIRARLLFNINQRQLKNNKKCPTPDCPGFINRGTCNLCLVIYCQQCYLPEHLGACIKQTDQTLPAGIVRCPKCGQGIQRDGGCLHMTCARPHCKFEFCFICRDKWSIRHHACQGGVGLIDAIINWFHQLCS